MTTITPASNPPPDGRVHVQVHTDGSVTLIAAGAAVALQPDDVSHVVSELAPLVSSSLLSRMLSALRMLSVVDDLLREREQRAHWALTDTDLMDRLAVARRALDSGAS